MIRLFELGSNNPQPLATFNGHKNNIVGLGFLQHNRLLYSGSEDGTLKLWDMRSASMCKDFPKAEEACSSVTILPSEVFIEK
jgi:G protein beta subunit-like protein